MARKQTVQSVEPQVADLVNSWLKDYGLDYKLEQESLNAEIDKALANYASKNGGIGGNRPDVKLLLKDNQNNYWPVLIEYKGYKNRLEKVDSDGIVANRKSNNEPNYKNINYFAVNGAIHYANALIQYTSYKNIISIGVTGYRDRMGKLQLRIGTYVVSDKNMGYGQSVGKYSDLSFLENSNFDEFVGTINKLELAQEQKDLLREKREREIDVSLTALNNDIYQNEKGLGENDRVYLVAATIISTIGIFGEVSPLRKEELTSSEEEGERDGEKVIRKINAFLSQKAIPQDKKDLVIRTLQNTLLTDNINKPINGESQLKRVFVKIVDNLGIYYKIGLNTDFTGKLFNEMYSWLGFSQDRLNDVVLTPSYVATLLVKLARINRDSYVWDFATGSAGLLVAAMNEMLDDAKANIHSPQMLYQKEVEIKARQLLGLEILPSIYMLGILNMIMMGDGSSNILNEDSLTGFRGKYGYGDSTEDFPATALILNPPYSAEGNGMIFVKHALSMMNHGFAAIIIQNSAGSGKAKEINKEILESNTLIASIKMPKDLFLGKSSVQTYIYVFQVGIPHRNEQVVKFVDFSNDGYSRSSRKKSKIKLIDIDNAKERYAEVVDIVNFGKTDLEYLNNSEVYQGHIDKEKGDDWNQSAPVEIIPVATDFLEAISSYKAWEVSNFLRDFSNNTTDQTFQNRLNSVEWTEFKIGDLFTKKTIRGIPKSEENLAENSQGYRVFGQNISYQYPHKVLNDKKYLTELKENEPIIAYTSSTAQIGIINESFYRTGNNGAFQGLFPKFRVKNLNVVLFILECIKRTFVDFDYNTSMANILDIVIKVPTKEGDLDFEFMESFVSEIKSSVISNLADYLTTSELSVNIKQLT